MWKQANKQIDKKQRYYRQHLEYHKSTWTSFFIWYIWIYLQNCFRWISSHWSEQISALIGHELYASSMKEILYEAFLWHIFFLCDYISLYVAIFININSLDYYMQWD